MTTAPQLVTLVPVKPGPPGKSRLAAALDDAGRTALIEWMLARVLAALAAARPGPVYVVGADPAVEAIAARHGCLALPEVGSSHNDTLARAMRATEPARAWLIVAADLPLIAADDIGSMAGDEAADAALLAPSHDGVGTNALRLPAACAIRPEFGAHSRARHLAAIAAAGCRIREVRRRGLAFDVDQPEDLDALLASLANGDRAHLSAVLRPDRRPGAGLKPA
jgi:2-phospho-L-lactate guanylyltransferase